MARLRQTEPKRETIGDYNFYIKPFPAMVAANLSGDLATMFTPVLAALLPLVGNMDENGDKDKDKDDGGGGLMDVDAEQAASSMAKSMEGFSGNRVESMMKKLLVTNKNIVVELPEYDRDGTPTGEVSQEVLDMDLANEIFCGEVQDMFLLAFYVIRLNFKGFFKKLAGRFGKAGEALVKKTRQIL